MKYSDTQRVEKISETTRKLLNYLSENQITQEMILEQEPLRWAITTPLYNIGEHAYQISDEFRTKHADIPWAPNYLACYSCSMMKRQFNSAMNCC